MAGTTRKTTLSSPSLKLLAALVLTAGLAGCAEKLGSQLPEIDETGDESVTEIETPVENGPGGPSSPELQKVILNQAMNLRFEKADVLEQKTELPAGTVIEFPKDYQVKNLKYRKSDGGLEWSSTGFMYPVRIVSVPDHAKSKFPDSVINSLNGTGGGLFISASIVGAIQGVTGNFAAIKAADPGAGFLKYYSVEGRPKKSYASSLTKRFGDKVNKGVDPATLSAADRAKWQKIYAELKRVGDRTVETPKALIMIDKAQAQQLSIDFEKTGKIPLNGAWTIAVQATSVRHGFGNVPCAETMSEVLRQAYQRAGYRVTDDFNKTKGNQLIWSNTAAVVNFSKALFTAGWVPWDATKYRPMTGAFLMNGAGYTPGHTYMAAGLDGSLIFDNGAPQGRDLRKSSDSTIGMMYQNGVFFLPPGINPKPW